MINAVVEGAASLGPDAKRAKTGGTRKSKKTKKSNTKKSNKTRRS